tara:strand:+ start:251 stop:715 length:465 start_codon:yes stop_codon:yes gene_type:complete
MDNSSLYESNFSDELDVTDSDSTIESGEESEDEELVEIVHKKKDKQPLPKSVEKKILVSVSEDVSIDDESVILLDGKNTKLKLPYLEGKDSKKTSKGKVFTGESITIISKKAGYEHTIRTSKGNYINGNSTVYLLQGGKSVVFHPIGKSWYADR